MHKSTPLLASKMISSVRCQVIQIRSRSFLKTVSSWTPVCKGPRSSWGKVALSRTQRTRKTSMKARTCKGSTNKEGWMIKIGIGRGDHFSNCTLNWSRIGRLRSWRGLVSLSTTTSISLTSLRTLQTTPWRSLKWGATFSPVSNLMCVASSKISKMPGVTSITSLKHFCRRPETVMIKIKTNSSKAPLTSLWWLMRVLTRISEFKLQNKSVSS